jgi:hypothetical protein
MASKVRGQGSGTERSDAERKCLAKAGGTAQCRSRSRGRGRARAELKTGQREQDSWQRWAWFRADEGKEGDIVKNVGEWKGKTTDGRAR